jgi:hypothetical protein
MTAEADIRETARRAAAILRERGWCQGAYSRHNGTVCLIGAVNVAQGRPAWFEPDPGDSPAFDAMIWRLEVATGCGVVALWNDRANRTADEVIAVLERVAAGEGQ